MHEPSRKSAGLGQWAEEQAARYLGARGYVVVARNYRGSRGEIDIVARQADRLVFIEVKARSGIGFGGPAAMVDRRKQQRLRRTALEFLELHRPRVCGLRFDVIALVVAGDDAEPIIEHIEDAF